MQQKLFAVCFLLYLGFCFSQNSISGKIYTSDLVPISGCHIHIGSRSASSNSKGDFFLKDVASNNQKVSIYCTGYESIDSTIYVNGNTKMNFTLKKKITELSEVVVQHKVNNYNKSVLENKIKSETIDKYSNQTLGEALKEVAGVSLLKTGSSIIKPIINGF